MYYNSYSDSPSCTHNLPYQCLTPSLQKLDFPLRSLFFSFCILCKFVYHLFKLNYILILYTCKISNSRNYKSVKYIKINLAIKQEIHNFFWWPDRATKVINYPFLVARTGNLVAREKKRSEMNGGNIRLRMTLKINVGCLSLASEMNGSNIRVRMMLRINVGCLSLTRK